MSIAELLASSCQRAPRLVDEAERLVVPDHHLRPDAQEKRRERAALRFRERFGPGVVLPARLAVAVPAPGEVPVQVDAVGVPPRLAAATPSGFAFSTSQRSTPAGIGKSLELADDGEAGVLVAVDAADHRHAPLRVGLAELNARDRPAENRVAEHEKRVAESGPATLPRPRRRRARPPTATAA